MRSGEIAVVGVGIVEGIVVVGCSAYVESRIVVNHFGKDWNCFGTYYYSYCFDMGCCSCCFDKGCWSNYFVGCRGCWSSHIPLPHFLLGDKDMEDRDTGDIHQMEGKDNINY